MACGGRDATKQIEGQKKRRETNLSPFALKEKELADCLFTSPDADVRIQPNRLNRTLTKPKCQAPVPPQGVEVEEAAVVVAGVWLQGATPIPRSHRY